MIQIIRPTDLKARQSFFARLRSRCVTMDVELLGQVSAIIDDVRKRGDQALVEFTERFDGLSLTVGQLQVSEDQIRESALQCNSEILTALRESITNVRKFHERQREESWRVEVGDSSWIGQRITPIDLVGLYVPGGTAAYPSSVVMNVVPAQVAGVRRIVVVTPPGSIQSNAAVAAALYELGVTEVYAVGGAQAIAALAYGTNVIPKVDKITGPGNKYVAAAKKLVFGDVGIDSIAGPSEVVIVADQSATPEFVAADLLAQAEHGEDASAIAICLDESLAESIVSEVAKQSLTLSRKEIVEVSLKNYGALILVPDLETAAELVNELAPEHVELMTRDNERLANSITNAGAIFLGPHSPEALGDYFAGPNHVLPTGSTARFSSALGVYDFLKRTSLISYSRVDMNRVAGKIEVLADAEGLGAHARSASIRKKSKLKLEL